MQLDSHVGPKFTGFACPGPTITDVEKTMACASISKGARTLKGSREQARVTWKRRARTAQVQPNSNPLKKQIGKRKKEGIGDAILEMGKKI